MIVPDQRPATRVDGETLPCPHQRARFELTDTFTAEEVALIRRGFVPRGSDDRWFLFVEDDWLYCHRSWTGAGIFGARLELCGDGARLTDCWVSRDIESYASDDTDADRDLLLELIRSQLLRRNEDEPFPIGITRDWSSLTHE